MEATRENDNEQTKLWNGPAGRAWVDAQAVLDKVLQPFEDLLVEAAIAVDARGVLDVGCGTGSTTLAVARRLGGKARCVGIDLSQQMITVARARAAHEGVPVSFICADAQTYAFEPDGFDLLISRFGVMFFNDPVRAFANLRSAAKPGANLRFIAWRSDAENPFMTTAERAAAPLLPDLPPRRPDAPGQFAFANDRRVRAILEASGWTHIGIRPIDVACSLSEEELSQYVTRLGPVGIYLQAADEATREKVGAVVRRAFDEYVMDGEARFTAACWMGEAKAPSGA